MSFIIPAIERSGARPFAQIPREWLHDTRLDGQARFLLALLADNREGYEVWKGQLVKLSGFSTQTVTKYLNQLRQLGYIVSAPSHTDGGRRNGSREQLVDLHLTVPARAVEFDLSDLEPVEDPYPDAETFPDPHRDTKKPGTGKPVSLTDNKTTNNNNLTWDDTTVAPRHVAEPQSGPAIEVLHSGDGAEENAPRQRPKKARRLVAAYRKLALDVATTVNQRKGYGKPPERYVIGLTRVIDHGVKAGCSPTEVVELLKAMPEPSRLNLDMVLTDPRRTGGHPPPEPEPDLRSQMVLQTADVSEPVRAGLEEYARCYPHKAIREGTVEFWERIVAGLGFEPTAEDVATAVRHVRETEPGPFTDASWRPVVEELHVRRVGVLT